MKENLCRSKMEEAAAKGKRTNSSSPLQAHNANGRGRQRPPKAKAKAKCYCGKAPALFSAVWGAGLPFQVPGRSAPIRSRCPGDCRAHCGLRSPGPGFLT